MDPVKFPNIHRHPLIRKEVLPEEENGICGLCGEDLHGEVDECSQCNFTAHISCAENPPSLVIDAGKIHEHSLTLLPRRNVYFTCNACGFSGEGFPYMCLMCNFMIHKECIDLPRVIKISRHPHRIRHTCFLGPGKWSCGVCREKICGKDGAYSCRICPDYAVHSTCARREEVWDGEELEGIPEKEEGEEDDRIEESEVSFVPRDDKKLISHFIHEHSLRLEDGNGDTKAVHCSGCVLPITSEAFYKCDDLCDFFLHKKCANLPQEITTFLHVHPLTLCTNDGDSSELNFSRCRACDLHFNGFGYRCLECQEIQFDIQCTSVSEPFRHHLHDSHDLFFTLQTTDANEEAMKICSVCNILGLKSVLSCTDCSFRLCFACATLPKHVNYKYDEHLLAHTIVEDAIDVVAGLYWCDLCETELNQKRNHYKCSDCGPVLHTECLLGSFRNMRPGLSFTSHGQEYQVVLNDRTSQLRCNYCDTDCHEPLFLMSTASTTSGVTTYFCSSPCFEMYVWKKHSSFI